MSNPDFKNRASELIMKHLRGELNEAEEKELGLWRAETSEHESLFAELVNEQHVSGEIKRIEGLKKRLDDRVYAGMREARETLPNLHFHTPIKKWLVAASVIFMVGIGSYFLLKKETGDTNGVEKFAATTDSVRNDIPTPKEIKAMIRLADGTTVALDSISSGTLVKEGHINVEKTADGSIIYSVAPGISSPGIKYSTLYNPAGSKVVPVTLSDGTKVWLNNESSLRFPTPFPESERRVEITGEAYFEVAKDALKGFVVTGNGITTEVLGTHFNINAYNDESNVKVTLIEGSLKVTKDAFTRLLKPGQQAQVTSEIRLSSGVDVEAVMAWKNGMFKMKSAGIGTIMRQIARWYDVEIIYENGVPGGTITGEVPRTLNLSEVLKVYEYSGIRYRIEGRRIMVKRE